ncbi:MAG TPA: secretin N-terminal domain-containing protein [Geminicoccaceae bacterium]|nr:secretin N-terminal domain-containing protein [Geminicoccaceae bacterium]
MPPLVHQPRQFGLDAEPAGQGPPTPLVATGPAQPGAAGPFAIVPERPEVRRFVDPGTGQFVGRAPQAVVTSTEAGEVTLSFVDADLRDVVRAILQDTLGENYVIDPQVSGTVTLQSSQPLPRSALRPLIDTILRLNGAALVRNGGIDRIVPLDRAAAEGLRPALREARTLQDAGYGLQVIPLAYARAEEMARLVQPFVPATAIVEIEAQRNLLLVTGTPEQVQTVLDMVEMFDTDFLGGMSFALEPLRAANAEEIVGELEQMFQTGDPAAAQARLRFVPVPRLNAVLVIAAQPAHLERARRWIQELDQGLDEDARLYIYHVQHGSAAALAEVLQDALGAAGAVLGRAPAAVAPGRTPFTLGGAGGAGPADTGRASAFGAGTQGDGARMRGGGAQPRREAGAGDAAGGLLAASDATRPAEQDPFAADLFGTTAAEGPGLRISADPTTNSLVIHATPREFRMIEQALARLDIVPLQVLIEATIAEVVLNDQLRFGLEWFFRFGNVETTLNAPVPAAPPTLTAILRTSDVRVVLTALDAVTDVRVISTPQLLVLDNQIARLQVGDEVPVVTQQAQSIIDREAPVINSVQYRDTGVILEVRPRVSGSGLALLEIAQEVSRVTETLTSGIDSPTFNQRRVTTTVAVHSGETVVLGGLIQDQQNEGASGIPGLRQIPVLGALFGTQSRTTSRTELLVLLTPRVLSGREDARAVTQDLRRRIHALPESGERPARLP